MQFLPTTWKRYGRGGDIQATGDAILAAARLLRANGAPGRPGRRPGRRQSQPPRWAGVRASASQLRATQRAFFGYYHWQVVYGDTSCPRAPPPDHPHQPPADRGHGGASGASATWSAT
jgi:hypothetical protein